MRAFINAIALLLASSTSATPSLELTHTLSPIEQEWLYVRASEASTLFISESEKGNETTYEIVEKGDRRFFRESNKDTTRSYEIDRIEKENRDYIIHYKDDGFAERTLIYPFRDVDEAWVLIHYMPQAENPVHFVTHASNKSNIPYLNE